MTINIIPGAKWGRRPWAGPVHAVPTTERQHFLVHYDGGTPITRTGKAIPQAVDKGVPTSGEEARQVLPRGTLLDLLRGLESHPVGEGGDAPEWCSTAGAAGFPRAIGPCSYSSQARDEHVADRRRWRVGESHNQPVAEGHGYAR